MEVPGQIYGMSVVILWIIEFSSTVHCSLCCRGPDVTLSGPVFFNITDFYHQWRDASPQNFYARHWVEPRKSVSNRAPHLLTPALPPRSVMKIMFLSSWSPMISSQCAESIRNVLCNSVQAFTTSSAVLRFTANGLPKTLKQEGMIPKAFSTVFLAR